MNGAGGGSAAGGVGVVGSGGGGGGVIVVVERVRGPAVTRSVLPAVARVVALAFGFAGNKEEAEAEVAVEVVAGAGVFAVEPDGTVI